MPSLLNEIGFFQFDNLIRNRIPFLILNLGADLANFYRLPLYQKQLESLCLNVSPESALDELRKRNLQPHEAVVVLCETGELSGPLVDQLESQGFSNVFYCKEGLGSLKADASH
jgi:hypothetical protein